MIGMNTLIVSVSTSARKERHWFDHTAMLLLAGGLYNEPQLGMWIGDDVEATNDDAYVQALGYEDCTQKYCDPFFFKTR